MNYKIDKISSHIIGKYISVYCFYLTKIGIFYLLITITLMLLNNLFYYIGVIEIANVNSFKKLGEVLAGIIIFTSLYYLLFLFRKHNKEIIINYSENVLLCGSYKLNKNEVYSVLEFRFFSVPFGVVKTIYGRICFCPIGTGFKLFPFWIYRHPNNSNLKKLDSWIKESEI